MTIILVINGLLLVIAVLLIIAEKYLITYGECKVIINKDKELEASGGENLLGCLSRYKIFVPSACGGKATCGFCKVQVNSGAGKVLPTEEPFLSREEIEKNIRLSCQVRIKGPVDISVPEYMLGAKEYESEVIEISSLTYDIKLLRLKLLNPTNITFKPGQYIQIRVPGTDDFRAYSVASTPDDNAVLDCIIRLVPGGLCSTYIHKALENHDKVIFTGAFGEFFLNEDSDKEIVGIAGGAGLAPIRAIAQYMANRGMKRKFTFFFGARSTKDLYMVDEFREMEKKYPNFKFIAALSEPKPQDKWNGETGFITQTADKYLDNITPKEFYLCGPPPMIDAALIVLKKKGIPPENILFDKF